jgi:DNA transformation protein
MATKQSTVDYILDQLSALTNVSARKMFGEYALYCDTKVVGLICDDILYIKITDPGKDFVGEYYKEGFPYPGAKPSMIINEDQIEDQDWLQELVLMTAKQLPAPKLKSKKKIKK